MLYFVFNCIFYLLIFSFFLKLHKAFKKHSAYVITSSIYTFQVSILACHYNDFMHTIVIFKKYIIHNLGRRTFLLIDILISLSSLTLTQT